MVNVWHWFYQRLTALLPSRIISDQLFTQQQPKLHVEIDAFSPHNGKEFLCTTHKQHKRLDLDWAGRILLIIFIVFFSGNFRLTQVSVICITLGPNFYTSFARFHWHILQKFKSTHKFYPNLGNRLLSVRIMVLHESFRKSIYHRPVGLEKVCIQGCFYLSLKNRFFVNTDVALVL